MLEDLIKLKQQLEQSHQYIAIKEISEKSIMGANDSKSLGEFQALENTDAFIGQCEALLEEATTVFSTNNIPYDTIQISTSLGFLCTPKFVEFLKTEYKNHEGLPGRLNLDLDNLGSNVSQKYVPVEFSINMAGSGLSTEFGVDDYLLDSGQNIPQVNELAQKRISGIVDFEKFIKKMKELGYGLELLNYGECSSMQDYVAAVKQCGWDTHLSVIADFSLEKSNNSGYGTR